MPSSESWTAGPDRWNPWANDARLLELYRRRCRRAGPGGEEMTCAAQAGEIIAGVARAGETLLDAGCGGGYYHWSFEKRIPGLRYHGLDHTQVMIDLARGEMGAAPGLTPESFRLGDIASLDREFDNILCFHVLSTSPHYAYLLDRLLACARKRLLLRESLAENPAWTYLPDPYLDEDKRHIQVYHNTYPVREVTAFMEARGFKVTHIRDRRTDDGMEKVCDVPQYWKILLAERQD